MAKCPNCKSTEVQTKTERFATLTVFSHECSECGEDWTKEIQTYSNPSVLSEDLARDFAEGIAAERG